ncbi:MAG TPA: hypothetical protein VLT32_17275 [Candidatus Sulfomarinibacteraceae bacterium]|nr:hypothetical protein [Candidatus Sulfomarinibacteraceae bacterium]
MTRCQREGRPPAVRVVPTPLGGSSFTTDGAPRPTLTQAVRCRPGLALGSDALSRPGWTGERGDDGTFPEGTVYHAVETSLRELARKSRAFSKPGGETPAAI